MSKKDKIPAVATPLNLNGNIARYGALFAREVIGALPNGGDFAKGTVAIDMDERQNLANATKAIAVHEVSKA